MNSDRWLTRLFGATVCLIAVGVTTTACVLFFREVAVPDPLDRLVTFVLGALTGRLTSSKSPEAGDLPATPAPVVLAPATSNLEQVPTTPPLPPADVPPEPDEGGH